VFDPAGAEQASGVGIDEQGEHHGGWELGIAGAAVIDTVEVEVQGSDGINDKVGEVVVRDPFLDAGGEEHGGLAVNVLESGSHDKTLAQSAAPGQEFFAIRARFSSKQGLQTAAKSEYPGF
jgi:hypothetical protein